MVHLTVCGQKRDLQVTFEEIKEDYLYAKNEK